MMGSFAGGMGFGLAFILEDQFSSSAAGIEKGMASLNNKTSNVAKTMGASLGRMAGIIGVGFSLKSAISNAAALSDELVGVSVVTGMADSEIEALRGSLEAMDTRTDLTDLLGLSKLGSQLGVAKEDLVEFTKTADAVGMVLAGSLGGNAEAAITRITKLNKVFNDTKNLAPEEGVRRMGAALDYLNDATTANISKVAAFANKLGEFGSLAPTSAQALGLGAALDELGIKAKGMASQYGNILTVIGSSSESMAQFSKQLGLSTDEFNKLFETDPNAVIMRLAKSFDGLSNQEMLTTMKGLKIGTQEAAKLMKILSNNTELVEKRQREATEAFRAGSSATDEAAMRQKTLAAQLEKIQRNFKLFLTRIGDAIGQGLSPFLDILNGIIKAFTRFAASPFGRAVVKYTSYIIGLGAAVLALAQGIKVMNGAIKLASRSAIRLMIALWPLALVAIPLMAIVLTVQKATKAFSEFDGTVKEGIGGMLQRFGGLIAAVKEIWNTWDSATQTFSINNKLMAKLKALGIDKWAIDLGTYVVRLKEFMGGMIKGMQEGFKEVMNVAKPIFNGLLDILEGLGYDISKLTGDTSKWAEMGKYLGYVIVGIGLAAGLLLMPFIVAGIIIYNVYKTIMTLWNGFKILYQGMKAGITAIIGFFITLGQYIGALFSPANWLKWGTGAIRGLLDGIKSAWGGLQSWLSGAVKRVPVIGAVVRWWNGEQATGADGQAAAETVGLDTGVMESAVENRVAMSSGTTGGGGAGANFTFKPQTINLNLDGDKIGEAVANYNENEMSKD